MTLWARLVECRLTMLDIIVLLRHDILKDDLVEEHPVKIKLRRKKFRVKIGDVELARDAMMPVDRGDEVTETKENPESARMSLQSAVVVY